MTDLFIRTMAQAVDAVLPLAVGLLACRVAARRRTTRAVALAALAAVPVSFVVVFLGERSGVPARWQAAVALGAVAGMLVLVRLIWPADPCDPIRESSGRAMAAAVAALVIVARPGQPLAASIVAAAQLRSLDAMLAIAAGVVSAVAICILSTTVLTRLSPDVFAAAGRWLAVVFVAQSVVFAVHLCAEAGMVPWSEAVHSATEPYGPEGAYGRGFSFLAAALPIVGATASARRPEARRRYAWLTFGAGIIVVAAAIVHSVGFLRGTTSALPGGPLVGDGPTASASSPRVLFRRTAPGSDDGRLTLAALAQSGIGAPTLLELTCERVSYNAGRGICLHADRGVFNTYTALLFDRDFRVNRTIKLAGRPSRTRISADGRAGAITVFVTGHGYAGSFSTRTTIVDMTSGDEIGDLEQFSTWRDGERFQQRDFNFWGVTFARDGNMFYASLRTGGATYLVRGDLGLRKLTLVRDNVECPSLSPDNRWIAFKKRVQTDKGTSWRLHVLDVATLRDRAITAEARYIDDQVEWLDDRNVLYGVPRRGSAISDVWVAPIDGPDSGRVFLSEAESPAVIR